MPLQLLNVTINSINIATAVIFEEMKNINNYYQKLKNKAKQKTQHPPKAEIASTGEKGPGVQTGLQTPGGRGGARPSCRAVTPHPPSQGSGCRARDQDKSSRRTSGSQDESRVWERKRTL